MIRVVGRHHRALAGAGDESPSVVGLEPVVVTAQPVEPVELGAVRLGPRHAVVDFGVRPGLVAPLPAACGLAPQQREPLGGTGTAPEMDDAGDVSASGDHELEDRIAQELTGDAHRDGPDAGDLATLFTLQGPAHEGGQVDSDQGAVLGALGSAVWSAMPTSASNA
jgi:hypothetical protein